MESPDPALSALDKTPCPACGAQAEWNPAKQGLVCPFCGTESPFAVDRKTGEIREIDLVQALRELPDDQRGWQMAQRTVQCQSCRAVMVFAPERVGQNCEFCGSPSLVDYEEIKAPIRPESLLPFKVSVTDVRERIRRWYASKWLAPGALKRKGLVDRIRGLYIPYWTFDARVYCPWSADAGYTYYVTEEYRDAKGQRQTRQVAKVRWEPVSGVVEHAFDDEPVPGTTSIHAGLLRAIEPFPTKELLPYDTRYLAGFVVQHYQVVLVDAARQSRESMRAQLMSLCAARIPGDTYRNLRIDPQFSGQTFKHILVPLWLLTYTYGAKAFQLVVNGYTGAMAGEYPKSVWKILLLILAVIAVALLIAVLADN